ncbi:anti-sigma factor domain-containing protein [Microbacterium koreense]|uniref:Regulator of SigK n=1 Tax=Microbacterium koreense TaxID=323761 RepID=A0ABW2ZQN8_9MICO
MNIDEFSELAAGYALGALSPDDRAAFEAAWTAHPEWSDVVDREVATAASLAEATVPVAPPLAMRGILLSTIAQTPQGPASDTAPDSRPADETAEESDAGEQPAPQVPGPPTTTTIQTISRRRWTRGLFALAASLVFLVAIGFAAASINEYVNRPASLIALEQIEQAPDAQESTVAMADGATATAHWSESLGQAVVVSQGWPQIADDEAFELWFVRDGTPVSGGVFTSSAGTTTALLDVPLEPGDTIAVTIEQADGSPTGLPTTDPIVAIPTV